MFGFWLAVFPWLGLCGGQGGPMMAFDDLSGGDSAPFGSTVPVGVAPDSGPSSARPQSRPAQCRLGVDSGPKGPRPTRAEAP
jgi:hypothetical protein